MAETIEDLVKATIEDLNKSMCKQYINEMRETLDYIDKIKAAVKPDVVVQARAQS